MKVILLEVAKECRGGTYMLIDELAPYTDESVEFLVNDELFYRAGDLTLPARPDSSMDMRQGPSGLGTIPDTNYDEKMDQDDNQMEQKGEKSNGFFLGALERDLLEYQFSEDDDGEVDGNLLLMTPSSFMSPTREAAASSSPVDPIGLAMDYRSTNTQKLLHESPRRRRKDETMRVSFLSTLPEDERERYQSELERKAGVTWNRVTFMERTWDVIRRYGTQSVMKVGLNQRIMREVLEKLTGSVESDVLTESVTEDSADDQQITRKLPVRRAKKKAEAVEREDRKQKRESESGEVENQCSGGLVDKSSSAKREWTRRWCDAGRGEKENLIPPMLLAGLTTTATRSKKNARTLVDTKLEMEVISQCGSGGLDDYKPSRTKMARMKLEGHLGVVEYSRITVPDSVHMGDPARGNVEMLKARNSARGHLMAMQEYLKELTENSYLSRKEYGTVMSSKANEIGLENC